LLTVLLAFVSAVSSAQQKHAPKTRPAKNSAAAPATADAGVPYQPGETLEYAAQWNKFVTAATVKLTVTGRVNFYGRNAWHFQVSARTLDPVRLLYVLDDQFDSYTDATSLACLQYESYIREQSKRQDLIVPMASAPVPAKRDTRVAGKSGAKSSPKSAANEAGAPRWPADTHVYMVLPGTRDPVGLLYSLRAQDWQREPAAHIPVFDGRRFYEVAALKESADGEVEVAAGKFGVTRIALRVFEGGKEMPNVRFWVSLAQDSARTPVLIEAEVPFGTVRVELTATK
jgi:hypothetical protein